MISTHLMPFDPDTASEDVVGKTVVALPELPPRFFIPRLDDKPQNPIMDTLRILQKNSHSTFNSAPPPPTLPPELVLLSGDLLKVAQARQSNLEDIWQSALLHRHGHTVSNFYSHAATCYKYVDTLARIMSFHGMRSAHPLTRTRILPLSSRNSPQTVSHPPDTSECCII